MSQKLYEYLHQNFNISLTEEQRSAVTALDGPVCLISCPGSGKTTVTVIRLANLIATSRVHPSHILPLTFSKSAAADMNKRFSYLFPTLSSHVKFMTIHRFGYQVIRYYEQLHHVSYQFVDQAHEPTSSAKHILTKLHVDLLNTYPSDDEIETIKTQISLMKNLMIEPTHVAKIKTIIDQEADAFIAIYKGYEAHKERHFLLDYDDVLQTAYGILKHDEYIRAQFQSRYTHIQVDEAQDLSKLQYELIKLLLTDSQNIFLVGDDDQSIYAFRGAYPQQLLDFKQTFQTGKIIYMSENFRSSKNIVSTSQAFIKLNKNRYKKDILTHNEEQIDPAFVTFSSQKKQLDYLIDACKNEVNLNEVAILYRQNVSALSVIETFERHNIPFRLAEGRLSFFTHPIVKDIEAMILLGRDSSNVTAYRRVARLLYLPATVIQTITSSNPTHCLSQTLQQATTLKSYQLEKIRLFMKELGSLDKNPPKKALHIILETLQYRSFLIKKGFIKDAEEATFTQGLGILETLKLIAENSSTLTDFLDRLAHLNELSSTPHSQNAVTLLTFHGSKGLEFDTVFLIDCMNGLTPPQNVIAERHQLGDVLSGYEEERRLFYVAMTRARTKLVLLSVEFNYNLSFAPSDFYVSVHHLVHPVASPSKKKTRLKRSVSELKKGLLSSVDLSPFKQGVTVVHNRFGTGVITDIDGEIATIRFDSDVKRISLRITVENDSLKLQNS